MSSPNREMIAEVARHFGQLLEGVVFVGGATTELFVTRPIANDIRVTKDIDVIIEAVNRSDYYRLAESLRERGFQEISEVGNPICWWSVDGHLVSYPENRASRERYETQGIRRRSRKESLPAGSRED